jgi:hypothetical protein
MEYFPDDFFVFGFTVWILKEHYFSDLRETKVKK